MWDARRIAVLVMCCTRSITGGALGLGLGGLFCVCVCVCVCVLGQRGVEDFGQTLDRS